MRIGRVERPAHDDRLLRWHLDLPAAGETREGEGDRPGARLPRHALLDDRLRREARHHGLPARRDDARAFAARIARDVGRLADAWEERRGSAFLLRYEDLVAAPRRYLAELAASLGIDASPASIDRMLAAGTAETADTAAHRTSEGWSQSTGRFRREMDAGLRRFCAEQAGDALSRLGYDPAP